MKTEVAFRTTAFNCTEPKDYFINDGCFGDGFMRDKCGFNFSGSKTVAADIYHVVNASHYPKITMFVTPGAIPAIPRRPGERRAGALQAAVWRAPGAGPRPGWPARCRGIRASEGPRGPGRAR